MTVEVTPPPPMMVDLSFEDGELIFREGQLSDYAYTIVSGRIALTKQSPLGPIKLAVLGEGEMMGEMGVLDGSVRSATAEAVGPVVLRGYTTEGLLNILSERPDTALGLIKSVVQRLRHANEAIVSPEATAASPRQRWLARIRDFFSHDQRAFDRLRLEFVPDAVEIEQRPMPLAARGVLYTIITTLVLGVIWACLAKVDRLVQAHGRFITNQPLITVQPLDAAIIRSLNVQVGQVVQAGDPLVSLDPTFVKAEEGASRADMVGTAALATRLEAEVTGKVPPHFLEGGHEEAVQREIFQRRIIEHQSQRRSFDEEIREMEAHRRTSERERTLLIEQRGTIQELETMRRTLLEQGYGSRVNWLDARQQLQSLNREVERQTNTLLELAHHITATEAKRESYDGEWRSKAAQELADARRQLARFSEQMRKTQRMTDLVEMRAPTRAMVIEIGARAVGSVVRQGETIMTLVAIDVPLQADVGIAPKDISYLRLGDHARLKVEAFPYQKHGVLEGVVRSITGDVVSEEHDGRKVETYKVRVDITKANLREVPRDYALVAGMGVDVEIKVGTRRLITYALYPVMRMFDSALREP